MTNLITEQTKPEDLIKEYSQYPNVAPEGIEEKPWYGNRMMPIFYEIPLGSKVLDVGANVGDFMEMLKKERDCEVFGVDVSEVCVKEAQEKGRNVQLADGHKLPFEDGTFDVVCLMEVLVHVFNPNEVLKEIKRVLKPGGFLLGSSPHKNLESHLWDDKRMHRRYYTTEELEDELYKVFDVAWMRTLTGAQFSFALAGSFLGKESAEILFKAGNKKTKPWEEALLDKSVLRVWFGFTQPAGDVYYRMSGYADKMRGLGAEIAYEPFSHNDFKSPGEWQNKIRWKHILNQLDSILSCADFSVWQIVQSKDALAFLRCAREVRGKKIITEIDDWLFDLPSYNLASNPYMPNSESEWIAYKQLEMSDAVIVSTGYLKERLSELFPGKKIYIIPNSIDFEIWDEIDAWESIPKKKEGFLRIGYTGCGNHSGDLEIVKKPLLLLLETFPNLEVVLPQAFESWKDVKHPRVIFANRWVPLPQYPGMVKGWDLDIGIAPLRDNDLNRAKSNLRWLEYSALKIPSVMSKVRPFEECIEKGQTGFLANSEKDWYFRLKELIESPELRTRIGNKAYNEVKRSFNMDKVAKHYIKTLKEIKR